MKGHDPGVSSIRFHRDPLLSLNHARVPAGSPVCGTAGDPAEDMALNSTGKVGGKRVVLLHTSVAPGSTVISCLVFAGSPVVGALEGHGVVGDVEHIPVSVRDLVTMTLMRYSALLLSAACDLTQKPDNLAGLQAAP